MKAYTPIDPKQRIEILDILRGFALLGIIFNNMLYFSGYAYTPYDNLKQIVDFKLNEDIYNLFDIIITAKFYTLFSILFAVGFYIQFSKHTEDSSVFLKVYRRRLLILLAIGLIHSIIWSGDILLTYSIIGFVLILFRNIKSKYLLIWSIFFILLQLFIDLALLPFFHVSNPISINNPVHIAHVIYPDMSPENVFNTFQNGTIGELFILNIHNLAWKYLSYIPSGGYFKLLGIFILGYYLAAIGFFALKSKSTLLLLVSLIIGLSATISANLLGGNPYQFPPTLHNILYKFLESTGQIFMCFFYITTIFKIVKTPAGKIVFMHLVAVGRMALSNYLFQTIIMIVIFYNFGFGLFGKIGLIQTSFIAFIILVLQIVFSNIWLRYFKFGPFEWLWRCLTYKKRIKILNDNI